ncbi:hypothetical protein DZ11F45_23100 [Escherichia coli]
MRISCIFVVKLQLPNTTGRDEPLVIMTYKYSQFENGQRRFVEKDYMFVWIVKLFVFVIYYVYADLVLNGVNVENK